MHWTTLILLLPGQADVPAEELAFFEKRVRPILEPIAGELPAAEPRLDGRERRTDAFRWLHGEFTSVARSGAGTTW